MLYLFTNRTGGESSGAFASLNLGDHVGDDPVHVAKNRARVEKDFLPLQFMSQEHGSEIFTVSEVSDKAPIADALFTRTSGIGLAVMVADCIPLLMYSEIAVAAVHVGRRGLMNRIAEKVIEKFKESGSEPIYAILGPSICGKCYEVSEDIYLEVTRDYPLASSRSENGKLSLDLTKALIDVLVSHGVIVENESTCTVENATLFSYRRDGITGRQAGLIAL